MRTLWSRVKEEWALTLDHVRRLRLEWAVDVGKAR